jgi:hypothetical protein
LCIYQQKVPTALFSPSSGNPYLLFVSVDVPVLGFHINGIILDNFLNINLYISMLPDEKA